MIHARHRHPSTTGLLLFGSLALACGARTPLQVSQGAGESSEDETADAGTGGASTTSAVSTIVMSGATETASITATSSAGPDAGRGFPVGRYTTCAEGLHTANGNIFLDVSGFETPTAVSVALTDGKVVVAVDVSSGHGGTLEFAPTTDESGTLAHPGTLMDNFAALCVAGPGDEGTQPASLDVTAGLFVYDNGRVFLSLAGTLSASDVGTSPCGPMSVSAEYWVSCTASGAADEVPLPDAGAVPTLPAGEYSCVSDVDAFDHIDGYSDSTTGGSGDITGQAPKLVLTQSGRVVRAVYSGDQTLSGTLDFDVLADGTGVAEPGQSMMAPCQESTAGIMAPLPTTAEPVAIGAGSLALVADGLLLSVRGTEQPSSSSVCAGEAVAATLFCTSL